VEECKPLGTGGAGSLDPKFGPFDGLFFDTFEEGIREMLQLHRCLPAVLRPGGGAPYAAPAMSSSTLYATPATSSPALNNIL